MRRLLLSSCLLLSMQRFAPCLSLIKLQAGTAVDRIHAWHAAPNVHVTNIASIIGFTNTPTVPSATFRCHKKHPVLIDC